MILDASSAWTFLDSYKALLLEIDGSPTKPKVLVEALVGARTKMVADPALIDAALAGIAARSETIDADVVEAARTVHVKQWVYLRDTRSYSVFIDPSGQSAYGVVGLTDRIRDITTGSGAFIETGVLCYKNRFVCDGLISSVVWLGSNYMRSFRDTLADLRAAGRFHVNCNAQNAAAVLAQQSRRKKSPNSSRRCANQSTAQSNRRSRYRAT